MQLRAGLAWCLFHLLGHGVSSSTCAGYDTTAIGLSWTIYHLASRPAIQAQIIAEVDAFGQQQPGIDDVAAFPFTQACFREAMRMNPPVNPLIPQACKLPCSAPAAEAWYSAHACTAWL